MASANWSFILTDTSFVPQGVIINYSQATVNIALDGIDTSTFRVRLDHPLAGQMRDCNGFVKIYRNSNLVFYGPILTAAETIDSTGAYLTINCSGVGWILSHRYIAPVIKTGGFDTPIVVSAIPPSGIIGYPSTILYKLLDYLNAESNPTPGDTTTLGANSNTLITHGTAQAIGGLLTYTPNSYASFSDTITNLQAYANNFFDWRVYPVENYQSSTGTVTGQFIGKFQTDVVGQARPNVLFECGTGRLNVGGYTRTSDRTTQANRVHVLPSSGYTWPSTATPTTPNLPAVTTPSLVSGTIGKWHWIEDVVSADLSATGFAQELADAHGNLRQLPRETIVFTPSQDFDGTSVPSFLDEWDVGDTIRARAVYNENLMFDALFRIWGVTFSLSEFGNETAALTLSPQGTS